jgi:hypothetical protein
MKPLLNLISIASLLSRFITLHAEGQNVKWDKKGLSVSNGAVSRYISFKMKKPQPYPIGSFM